MKGKKTYLVGALMLVHAIGSFLSGGDQAEAVQELLTALGLLTLRAGIKKAEPDA